MIRGGQNYVSSPPSFSNDGKRLLVCTGTTVSIFSTSTCLQISSLEGHTDTVTSVIVVPYTINVLCNCWTASIDGTIRYWDFSIPECIKTLDLQSPITSMVIPSILRIPEENNAKSPNVFAYVSVLPSKAQQSLHKIRKCNLTNYQVASKLVLKETERPESLTVSPSGKYLGIKDKRRLHIWKVPNVDSDSAVPKKITLHHTKTFTVLAFHPTDRIVAAGDVTGRVLIWRGFGTQKFLDSSGLVNRRPTNDSEDKPGVRENDDAESCSTWHWHSSGVKLLSFSSDGAYLYSGGQEGVLVLWQLDTGKKKFLPRIGSSLLYFLDSPDPSLSLISCADNQIHILKVPSMEIVMSISGIKPRLSSEEVCESFSSRSAAFDHSSGLVAVQTENYCIQFYSLFANRGLYEVQACERNHHPGDVITVVVTLVELSIDGSMMGTVEVKLPEEGIGGLVCLKFWDLDTDSRRFSVSTLIYEPHRDAHISAVAFHPTRHMAVSSSYGGDFKIWRKNEVQQKNQMLQNSGWICHAVGSYKNKAMRAAAFSADGSVLAVAADTVITLWDPDKNVLVAIVGETSTPIVSLNFAGKSEYLLSVSHGSKPQLSVWNMSKLASSWSYRLQVEAVSCALDLSYFAILALLPESSKHTFKGDGLILLFNVTDPVPVASWSVTKAKGGALGFLKGDLSEVAAIVGKTPHTLLAYINGDREFVLFDPYVKEAHELSITRPDDLVASEETGQFGYASIYGELPKFDLKRNQTISFLSAASERPWETIFRGESHMLPPLTKLCSEFLESLLERRTAIAE
ncbi:PREDICTED: WD repeat-containing protein 75-like [Lupinus angustifolius]|uniref:WD repeat-containing protein 75-like n=1 Tax=Lupinus angustifolius TaxID=3871 RepID=UPI00092EFF2C|nr:PREDICTED: WD repeat-containing protein 75-like [Lupinus angustifolius]